jgi:hypothetical protein
MKSQTYLVRGFIIINKRGKKILLQEHNEGRKERHI